MVRTLPVNVKTHDDTVIVDALNAGARGGGRIVESLIRAVLESESVGRPTRPEVRAGDRAAVIDTVGQRAVTLGVACVRIGNHGEVARSVDESMVHALAVDVGARKRTVVAYAAKGGPLPACAAGRSIIDRAVIATSENVAVLDPRGVDVRPDDHAVVVDTEGVRTLAGSRARFGIVDRLIMT